MPLATTVVVSCCVRSSDALCYVHSDSLVPNARSAPFLASCCSKTGWSQSVLESRWTLSGTTSATSWVVWASESSWLGPLGHFFRQTWLKFHLWLIACERIRQYLKHSDMDEQQVSTSKYLTKEHVQERKAVCFYQTIHYFRWRKECPLFPMPTTPV